jgi:hypothetical protein
MFGFARRGIQLLSACAGAAGAAFALAAPLPASAAGIDFRVVTLQSKGCGAACPQVIAADGDIDEKASERFLGFVSANVRDKRVKNVVFINSSGGQVVSALKLGLRMRQFGTAVVVARVVEGSSDDPNGQFVSARCMSACVFVLMGGKKRVVPSHSQVGIHRMFRDEFGPDPAGDRNRKFERMFASGSMVDIVSRYTGAMGISRDLISTAERVSPDDIHIVTPGELTRWRLGSPKL